MKKKVAKYPIPIREWSEDDMSEQSGDPDHRDLFAMSYFYRACPVEPGTLRVFNWDEILKDYLTGAVTIPLGRSAFSHPLCAMPSALCAYIP